jgi:hypothetical protein
MLGSRHAGTFEAEADPDDVGILRDALTGWLESNGWKPPTWGRFSLLVRHQGEYRIRKTIRANP